MIKNTFYSLILLVFLILFNVTPLLAQENSVQQANNEEVLVVEAYKKYHESLLKINVNDVFDSLSSNHKRFDKDNKKMAEVGLAIIASSSPVKYEVVSVTINGNKAVLNIKGLLSSVVDNDKSTYEGKAAVNMIKESNVWKIDSLKWIPVDPRNIGKAFGYDLSADTSKENTIQPNKEPIDQGPTVLEKKGPDIDGDSNISGFVNLIKKGNDGYLKIQLTKIKAPLAKAVLTINSEGIDPTRTKYNVDRLSAGTYNINAYYTFKSNFAYNHIYCNEKTITISPGQSLTNVDFICK